MNLREDLEEKKETIYGRLKRVTVLEVVGIIAIGLLIINSLFQVEIAVSRKPLLDRILSAGKQAKQSAQQPSGQINNPALERDLEIKVLPPQGVELPVTWKDLGKQLIAAGVIDKQKIEALYAQRGGMDEEMKKMLYQESEGKVRITQQNSTTLLNLFWALGLGNKNDILDKGEMQDPRYGGAGKFASTGGWSLASGQMMDHYSKHQFVRLTPQQQALVDSVSRNIFRPCCGNSTHFPDCNHGMAMLGLLELMASQGVSESEMYRYALVVNSYWFPDTYLTIAKYLKSQGKDFAQASPQELLSAQYSSGQGYRQILNQVQPVAPKGGGGCGV